MFGRLLICKSCESSVDKGARECPSCHAALQKKGLSAGGLLGLLVFLASMPGCLVVGPVAALPMILGLLMLASGRTWSPVWFRLRTFKPDDYHRLGVRSGQGAWFTPNVESLVAGVGLLLALSAVGLYVAHLIKSA